ncbi:hypothetical protein GCM10010528_20550 [Gordonia defluvii]|uniref:Uncharacterized protein n=1 Tax=Gordonia defluvii TaxID=283718 RepID=A0ABP6LI01_9ACTN
MTARSRSPNPFTFLILPIRARSERIGVVRASMVAVIAAPGFSIVRVHWIDNKVRLAYIIGSAD